MSIFHWTMHAGPLAQRTRSVSTRDFSTVTASHHLSFVARPSSRQCGAEGSPGPV